MKFPWYKYKELPLSKRNTLQIFITNRCNLRCDGCFARNAMGTGKEEMAMEEYEQAVTNAARKGAGQINILGGEPLLHPKLDSMCRYNANRAIPIKTTIYTNGTLLKENLSHLYFHGAKLRVSLDSFVGTKKAVTNLVEGHWPRHIDANFMISTKTTATELYNSANVLEDYGCKVFFLFSMLELAHYRDFFDSGGNDLAIPVLEYKRLVHEFLQMYNGNMEIHFSKRGVFESTLDLPHNKCKFANYFIGGKIIQCPYDVVNLKYQVDYEFNTRYCQQNSTCLMSKIKLQRIK